MCSAMHGIADNCLARLIALTASSVHTCEQQQIYADCLSFECAICPQANEYKAANSICHLPILCTDGAEVLVTGPAPKRKGPWIQRGTQWDVSVAETPAAAVWARAFAWRFKALARCCWQLCVCGARWLWHVQKIKQPSLHVIVSLLPDTVVLHANFTMHSVDHSQNFFATCGGTKGETARLGNFRYR